MGENLEYVKKNNLLFLENKIEGTLILQLAMVKELRKSWNLQEPPAGTSRKHRNNSNALCPHISLDGEEKSGKRTKQKNTKFGS